MSKLGCILVSAALAAAPAAHAASARATSSATIFKPMTIATAAQMSFGKLQYNGAGPAVGTVMLSANAPVTRTSADVQLLPGGGETPAIRNITGEPGRAYRVTVSPTTTTPGGLTVNNFRIWSANSGDITARSGMLSSSGADTIRVGATLSVPRGTKNDVYTALPTINIAYE